MRRFGDRGRWPRTPVSTVFGRCLAQIEYSVVMDELSIYDKMTELDVRNLDRGIRVEVLKRCED